MLSAFVEKFNADDPVTALEIGDRPEQDLSPGWTVVDVRAASINHHDVWSLRGVGLTKEQLPMIIGCDAAGVDADGNDVVVHAVVTDTNSQGTASRWSVLSERHQGTFAERVAAPKANLVPKPEGLSFEEAACLPTAWLTAFRMLFREANVSAGDTVLVQGGGGGLSTALIMLGAGAGLRMWVTSRTKAKRSYAKRIGAHEVFPSGTRLPERVDAVMDSVGADTWSHSLKTLRRGGTMVVAGATSGYIAQIEIARVFANRLRIIGTAMGTADDLDRLIRFCVTKSIAPPIQQTFPLDQAREGLKAMVQGDVLGKLVLQM